MKISFTKKPMNPMIENPITVCKQIFLYSARERRSVVSREVPASHGARRGRKSLPFASRAASGSEGWEAEVTSHSSPALGPLGLSVPRFARFSLTLGVGLGAPLHKSDGILCEVLQRLGEGLLKVHGFVFLARSLSTRVVAPPRYFEKPPGICTEQTLLLSTAFLV